MQFWLSGGMILVEFVRHTGIARIYKLLFTGNYSKVMKVKAFQWRHSIMLVVLNMLDLVHKLPLG